MEEAELNIHSMGLITSLETYVNIYFWNNIKNFVLEMKICQIGHTWEGFMFLNWMGIHFLEQESSFQYNKPKISLLINSVTSNNK